MRFPEERIIASSRNMHMQLVRSFSIVPGDQLIVVLENPRISRLEPPIFCFRE
jgi:hypothetical protein